MVNLGHQIAWVWSWLKGKSLGSAVRGLLDQIIRSGKAHPKYRWCFPASAQIKGKWKRNFVLAYSPSLSLLSSSMVTDAVPHWHQNQLLQVNKWGPVTLQDVSMSSTPDWDSGGLWTEQLLRSQPLQGEMTIAGLLQLFCIRQSKKKSLFLIRTHSIGSATLGKPN